MPGGNHTRARQLGAERQGVGVQMHQIGNEQEQPSDPRRELARRQREATDVGDGLGAGPGLNGTLVVEPAWQRSEPLRGEHLAYRGGTQRHSLVRERPTDLIDRVVALAQSHDLLVDAALLGLLTPARPADREEVWQLTVAEGIAQHPERARGVAEPTRRRVGPEAVDEISAQRLVLALTRGCRLGEKATARC